MPKRLDAQDTVESAAHLLMKLAAEGWCLESIDLKVEHQRAARKGRRHPVRAHVKVTLVPVLP